MRNCTLLKNNASGSRQIWIDNAKSKDIIKLINDYQVKFDRVCQAIIENKYNSDQFDKVHAAKDIWSIKLGNHNTNARIYCKEIQYQNSKNYVLIYPLPLKKGQKIAKKDIENLKTIGKTYHYVNLTETSQLN